MKLFALFFIFIPTLAFSIEDFEDDRNIIPLFEIVSKPAKRIDDTPGAIQYDFMAEKVRKQRAFEKRPAAVNDQVYTFLYPGEKKGIIIGTVSRIDDMGGYHIDAGQYHGFDDNFIKLKVRRRHVFKTKGEYAGIKIYQKIAGPYYLEGYNPITGEVIVRNKISFKHKLLSKSTFETILKMKQNSAVQNIKWACKTLLNKFINKVNPPEKVEEEMIWYLKRIDY
jgi:hypothetical protein